MVLRGSSSELIFTSRARCMAQHNTGSRGGMAWSAMISGFARKAHEDAMAAMISGFTSPVLFQEDAVAWSTMICAGEERSRRARGRREPERASQRNRRRRKGSREKKEETSRVFPTPIPSFRSASIHEKTRFPL